MKQAGIEEKERYLGAHSLRHTYNTFMRNSLSETYLHYMIGHRSRLMTDRYDQAKPQERLKIMTSERDKIDRVWQ